MEFLLGFIVSGMVFSLLLFYFNRRWQQSQTELSRLAEQELLSLKEALSESQEQFRLFAQQHENSTSDYLQLISTTLDESANGADATSNEVEVILENAATLSEHLSKITQISCDTCDKVGNGVETIADLRIQLEHLIKSKDQLSELSEKFQQINSKSDAIRSLGSAAEMLALNAAIEAARAGDAGRGFSIVADNMKELAKRSQESSVEIISNVSANDRVIKEIVEYFNRQGHLLSQSLDQVVDNFSVINSAVIDIRDRAELLDLSSNDNHQVVHSISANVKTSVETLVQRLSKLVSMITKKEVVDVSPQEAKRDWESYDEIIDVRREKEWNDELGHIPNVIFSTLQTDFKEYVKSLDRNKKYLFICRSGGRSTKAAQMALAYGIAKVYNLDGGMLAWRGAGQ